MKATRQFGEMQNFVLGESNEKHFHVGFTLAASPIPIFPLCFCYLLRDTMGNLYGVAAYAAKKLNSMV
jgi:hypothetical protein